MSYLRYHVAVRRSNLIEISVFSLLLSSTFLLSDALKVEVSSVPGRSHWKVKQFPCEFEVRYSNVDGSKAKQYPGCVKIISTFL